MVLVDYSDSESSENDKVKKNNTHIPPVKPTRLKRKRSLGVKPLSDLPPLPDSFHDLYASTARVSKQDDPSLHAGRQRQIPHVEGQWPTHVYIEWHPSRSEIDTLSDLLVHAKQTLPPDVQLHSLLTSDLGAGLPLHISLSRTLTLGTHQRQPFVDDLEKAIHTTGVKPFRIGLSRLRWVANYENNRWFLVLQAQKPPGNELNSLLRASNGTARRYGQPRLYQSQQTSKACDQVGGNRGRARFSKNRKTGQSHARIHIPAEADEDATDQFHISIGWTLETPGEIPLNAADVVDGGDAPSRPELSVQTVKARIGNGVVAIALAAKAVDSNGIVGV